MIAKLTLIASKTNDHPMDGRAVTGYVRELPQVGHSVILWYALDGRSRYLRTSTVQAIVEPTAGRGWRVVETMNSSYRMEIMPVHFESESIAFSAAVNGRIKENSNE